MECSKNQILRYEDQGIHSNNDDVSIAHYSTVQCCSNDRSNIESPIKSNASTDS